MSRDKQTEIEEMAKDMCEYYYEGTCYQDKKPCDCRCECFTDAQYLYAKGYRKASDVALEVIKEIEHILTVKIIGIEEDFFHGTAAHWDGTRKSCYEEMLVELAELKKKYTESEKDYGKV